MVRRRSLAAFLVILPLAAGCSRVRDPIQIDEGTVSVENQTTREWRNVVVTVNDHFRGGAARLAAGSRLAAPLAQFQTAFGQRFSLERQTVFKVEVTATDSSGEAVKLEWGQSRR